MTNTREHKQEPIYKFPEGYNIFSTALLPNDDLVAFSTKKGTYGNFLLHCTENNTHIYPIDNKSVDGRIFILDDKHILIWRYFNPISLIFNVETGKQIGSLDTESSLIDKDTKDREIKGLAEALEWYPSAEGLIITADEIGDDEIQISGKNRIIKILPIWKWLLQ